MDAGLLFGLASLAAYYPFYKLNKDTAEKVNERGNTGRRLHRTPISGDIINIPGSTSSQLPNNCIGGIINPLNGVCVCEDPNKRIDDAGICECMLGYTKSDNGSSLCVKIPCEGGSISAKKCICDIDGQIPNVEGICQCPNGMSVYNGKCITCLGGSINDFGNCVCDISSQTPNIYGVCVCPTGGEFNDRCVACIGGRIDKKGICECNEPGQIPDSTGKCGCVVGGLFNNKCVSCANGTINAIDGTCECNDGYSFTKYGTCIATTIAGCENGSYDQVTGLCSCPSNMQLVGTKCICNDSGADSNNHCACLPGKEKNASGLCQTIQCSGGTLTDGICQCSGGKVSINGVCVCGTKGTYLFNNKCTLCDGTVLNDKCICDDTIIAGRSIDQQTGECACVASTKPGFTSYVFKDISGNRKCRECDGELLSQVGYSTCTCRNGQVLNSDGICVCDTNYYQFIKNGIKTCVKCDGNINTSGECVCNIYGQSPSLSNGLCECTNSNEYTFTNSSGVSKCVLCSGSIITVNGIRTCACLNGQHANADGICECDPGKYYNTTLQNCVVCTGTLISNKCSCPVGMAIDTTLASGSRTGACVCLDSSNNYDPNADTANGCACKVGYIKRNGKCEPRTYYGGDPNSLSCPSTGTEYDAILDICKCVAPNNYVKADGTCVPCGQGILSSDKKSCICNPGYSFDTTYGCMPSPGTYYYNDSIVPCAGTVTTNSATSQSCTCNIQGQAINSGGVCACPIPNSYVSNGVCTVCNGTLSTVNNVTSCTTIQCLPGATAIGSGSCTCTNTSFIYNTVKGCVCPTDMALINNACVSCTSIYTIINTTKTNLITIYNILNNTQLPVYPILSASDITVLSDALNLITQYTSVTDQCTNLRSLLDGDVSTLSRTNVNIIPILSTCSLKYLHIIITQRNILNTIYNFVYQYIDSPNSLVSTMPYPEGRLKFFNTTIFPLAGLYYPSDATTLSLVECNPLSITLCAGNYKSFQMFKSSPANIVQLTNISTWTNFLRSNLNNYTGDTSPAINTVSNINGQAVNVFTGDSAYVLTDHSSAIHDLLINNFLKVRYPRRKPIFAGTTYTATFPSIKTNITDTYPVDTSVIDTDVFFDPYSITVGTTTTTYNYIEVMGMDELFTHFANINNITAVKGIINKEISQYSVFITKGGNPIKLASNPAWFNNLRNARWNRILKISAYITRKSPFTINPTTYPSGCYVIVTNSNSCNGAISVNNCIINDSVLFESYELYPKNNLKTDTITTGVSNGMKYIKFKFSDNDIDIQSVYVDIDKTLTPYNCKLSILVVNRNNIVLRTINIVSIINNKIFVDLTPHKVESEHYANKKYKFNLNIPLYNNIYE